jgi:hypothetical protein
VIDEFAKEYLHDDMRWIRKAVLSKLDGLSEYDIRRPLTPTGTNLLGLIKHLATWEARYFGEETAGARQGTSDLRHECRRAWSAS